MSPEQSCPYGFDHSFSQSFDAAVWAKAFVAHVKANPEIATDEGTMLGWFANAIMRGYDEYARQPHIVMVERARRMIDEMHGRL